METTITLPVPVPEGREVQKMLFELIDKAVRCSESTVPVETGGTIVAIYQGKDKNPLAANVVDLAFAVASSAALVRMPPRIVDEAKKQGALPESLVDVFHEVANIFSALMNSARSPHLVLRRVTTMAELDDEERAVLASPRRLLQTIDVEGYGTGYCAFVCA
jgi:hypothetical protein